MWPCISRVQVVKYRRLFVILGPINKDAKAAIGSQERDCLFFERRREIVASETM